MKPSETLHPTAAVPGAGGPEDAPVEMPMLLPPRVTRSLLQPKVSSESATKAGTRVRRQRLKNPREVHSRPCCAARTGKGTHARAPLG